MMKNCGPSVYREVNGVEFQRDFQQLCMNERKKGMYTDALDKALHLCHAWHMAFEPYGESYGNFEQTYKNLKGLGFNFPPVDSSYALIPNMGATTVVQQPANGNGTALNPRASPDRLTQTSPTRRAGQHSPTRRSSPTKQLNLPSQKKQKLQNDLAMVKGNAELLHELLDNVGPGEDIVRNDLIQETVTTLRAIHDRLAKLLEELTDEELLMVALEHNELVIDALGRYDRLASGKGPMRSNRDAPLLDLAPADGPRSGSESPLDFLFSLNNGPPHGSSSSASAPTPEVPAAAQRREAEEDAFAQIANRDLRASSPANAPSVNNNDEDDIDRLLATRLNAVTEAKKKQNRTNVAATDDELLGL
jgi:hypothetical protein